ncbi:hypothetical protein [Streptomyces sp. 35G-GA-8]|uniref:hypothetical protein n=1 Tax=Streptomyces sp. 35G-GA-8 TaxID=2939434 RepID=UPI00201EDEDC|nr:hypothetical protein [Streptomyces sp. 35G-GA-8]MCL7377436.1 hypothetical protein [Streptomyces sp. 35G-GA-8]
MPWVRLDDRFPSHRKVALLSDRAFRLYVSALCWSSENLTEGKLTDRELTLVARVRDMKKTARELEDARLWDRVEDGWMIHDFLEYNPDRAKVKADREANAARQQAYRERKKAEQDAKRNADEIESNGVTNASRNASRNGGSNDTPSPSPSRPVPPTEEPPPPPPSTNTPGTAVAEPSGRGEVQPLIEAMAARGMNISWTFQATEWLELRDAIRRVGVPALVDHAARAWQAAKTTPYSARYFLTGWTGLQDAPAYTGPRAIPGPPSATSEYLADMANIAAELRAAEDAAERNAQ